VPRKPKKPFAAHISTSASDYFLDVTVRNIGCFGVPQTLRLRDKDGKPARWTLLLGNNGSGKTTLLRSIASLNPVPLYFPPSTRHLAFRGSEWAARNLPEFYHLGEEGVLGDAEITATVVTAQRLGDLPQSQISVTCNPGQLFYYFSKSEPLAPLCHGYGAGRKPGKTTLGEGENDDPVSSLFDEASDLLNAEEWFVRTDYAERRARDEGRAVSRRLDVIRDVLIKLLPEVTDIRLAPPDWHSQGPVVQFLTPTGWLTLRALGLGYQTLITWMVDFAARLFDRYPESENPLAERAVLLIDEIDLHLHPAWQRVLIREMSVLFPNTQFIATAHSPLIVQAAGEDANIAVLRRDGDHVVIDNNPEAIRGWRVDQILTSDLFELPSARPPEYDQKIARRKELVAQASRSPTEQKELDQLDAEITSLPTGQTDDDARRMMKLAEESQELLKKYGG
jgi:energy-coupling factor transporter ATP-binding protein EcfA2